MSPQQLDALEATSCVRDASRSVLEGLNTLHYLPDGCAASSDVAKAQALLRRAQQRLQLALLKITQQPAGNALATGEAQ